MLFQSAVVVALLASFTAAQTTANSTINPSSVDLTTRAQWCQGQTNTCGTLCGGEVNLNTCLPDTLNYTCTCSSNNSAPGLQYYKETMPTFICEQVFANCIKAGANDAAAQNVCNKNEKANCGQLSPDNFTAAVTTTSTAATTAASTSGASAATGTGASSSSSKAAAATLVANAKYFGTGALAVGLGAMGLLI